MHYTKETSAKCEKKTGRKRNILENKTGKEGGKERQNFYEMTFMLCTINHIDLAKSEFFLTLEYILKILLVDFFFVENSEHKMNYSLNK